MSSSRGTSRRRFLALFLVAPALAGCSFTPLYGSGSALDSGGGFAYAEPKNRLEQIIYQELAFRLGRDTSPDAPLVTISASSSEVRVGRVSTGSVMTTYQSIVTAKATVDLRGAEPKRALSDSRFASALYEISSQLSANESAKEDAREKASRAVADSLRLLLAAARKAGDI